MRPWLAWHTPGDTAETCEPLRPIAAGYLRYTCTAFERHKWEFEHPAGFLDVRASQKAGLLRTSCTRSAK
jgi:hypothetical protein